MYAQKWERFCHIREELTEMVTNIIWIRKIVKNVAKLKEVVKNRISSNSNAYKRRMEQKCAKTQTFRARQGIVQDEKREK